MARDVYISFGNLDANVSDNYFDLLPGKAAEVTLTSNAPLDQLRNALTVVSLVDAFPPGRVIPQKSPVMP